jgi:hypothetical protein
MGTLGVSEAGEAWDWRLTDIHVSLSSRKNVVLLRRAPESAHRLM